MLFNMYFTFMGRIAICEAKFYGFRKSKSWKRTLYPRKYSSQFIFGLAVCVTHNKRNGYVHLQHSLAVGVHNHNHKEKRSVRL